MNADVTMFSSEVDCSLGAFRLWRSTLRRRTTGHTHHVSVITQNMSDTPLMTLFSSRPLVRLLSVFLMNPERSYYQQELVRMTGDSLRPVQLALAKLERADLIATRRDGRQVYYQVRTSHPAYGDLRSLFEKTFALGDVLREALRPVADEICVAFVYGSTAAGEERSASDVDLMIVGSSGRQTIARALGDVETRLGRPVNVVIYSAERLAESVAARDSFVMDVLDGPKLWLVGDEDELERLAR